MAPPRKKPKRVHPWRDEYVRELGVRIVDRDANTGDVLTVECCFCAAFGREERVLDGAKKETERAADGNSNDDGGSSGRDPNDTTASINNASNNNSSNGAEPPRKRKSRARTRSIAQWKTSFRTDNMRSHHLEQHPLKWGEYQQLLALVKKEQALHGLSVRQPHAQGQVSEVNGGDELVYTQQFLAFFGDPTASEEAPTEQAALSSEAQLPVLLTPKRRGRKVSLSKKASPSSHHEQQQTQDKNVLLPATGSSTLPEVFVLTEITSPAIMDEVVASLIDTECEEIAKTSDGGTDSGNGSGPPPSFRPSSSTSVVLQPIYSAEKTVAAHVLDAAADKERQEPPGLLQASKYRIALESVSEFSFVRQLLAMEDSVSFAQISSIVAISKAQFNLESRLSRVSQATVREYAKLVVTADLQMIADMLCGSWAYSLTLQGSERSEREKCVSIDVHVRFPRAGGTGVEDFHLVTVTSPTSSLTAGSERSSSVVSPAMAELIIKTLTALDPLWQKKLIGMCDEASMGTMDVVASVLDRIEEAVAGPFYRVYRGAQIVEASLLKALKGSVSSSDTGSEDQGPTNRFLEQLAAAIEYLHSQPQWSTTHGLCLKPLAKTNPWSLLEMLQWFVMRREQIGQLQSETEPSLPSSAGLSSEWWVVCLGLTDVLSDFEAIYQTLNSKTESQHPHAARESLSQFVKDQSLKLGISQVEAVDQVDHLENSDDASLRLKRFLWPNDKIVAFFRSLNLSTRRLFSQLSQAEQASAVHQVGAFVLQSLDAMALMISEGGTTTKKTSHPAEPDVAAEIERLLPTRPLDFVAIERGAVVDFIEHHSARLELSFDLAFIDAVSKQIKDVHALIAGNAILKATLVAAHGKSFREAWEPVKTFSFVRSLAAGFATAMPRNTSIESQPMDHFSRIGVASNGVCLASLQAEAQTHALQSEAVEASYKSFKLGHGSHSSTTT